SAATPRVRPAAPNAAGSQPQRHSPEASPTPGWLGGWARDALRIAARPCPFSGAAGQVHRRDVLDLALAVADEAGFARNVAGQCRSAARLVDDPAVGRHVVLVRCRVVARETGRGDRR